MKRTVARALKQMICRPYESRYDSLTMPVSADFKIQTGCERRVFRETKKTEQKCLVNLFISFFNFSQCVVTVNPHSGLRELYIHP